MCGAVLDDEVLRVVVLLGKSCIMEPFLSTCGTMVVLLIRSFTIEVLLGMCGTALGNDEVVRETRMDDSVDCSIHIGTVATTNSIGTRGDKTRRTLR